MTQTFSNNPHIFSKFKSFIFERYNYETLKKLLYISLQMSDFEEMLAALKEMKHESGDVQAHLAHLLEIQNKAKLSNFQRFTSEKVSQVLDDFWLFLMHSSSNSLNTSIRIAAVRAAAYLTLNLYPFYPEEVKNTFSTIATISTIDMSASSLIASVFGIISYHISTPYRSNFLQSCPIFHHITEFKTNQEHFISSLSHYSHLGLEFHRDIIKCFMSKITADTNDKLYWHAVIEIVTKNPKEFFNEVFTSLCENNYYQIYIQFMSCLLTIPEAPINSVDLYEIAKYALKMLADYSNNSRDLTINEKSAIFTILSLKPNSFFVKCSIEEKDKLKITLSDSLQSNEVEQICQISMLNDIPEFYLLSLPCELAFPDTEEGSTLLAAKISLLTSYLDSEDENLVQKILDIIKSYVSKPYDTTVSACFQGMSKSIPKLKKKDVLDSLTKILDLNFFSPSLSWFHDMDRLKVIDSLPLDAIARALGNKTILPSFNQVLIWAKEKNDKLAKYAQQVLIHTYILQSDAELLLAKIIKECDIFDTFDLLRTLEILNQYLEKYRKQFMPHFLIDFCKSMMQLFSLYPDDPDVYIQLLTFISHFHIKKLRTFSVHICLAVIISTYNIITGMNETIKELDNGLVEREYNMVNSVLSKQSMDIIKENLNNYSSYAPHLYATLRFLISVQKIDFAHVQQVVHYTINLFPYEASQLAFKHWKYLPQMTRTSFISNNYNVIKNAGGFNCAGIWFELYIKTSETVPESNNSSYPTVSSGPFAYSTYSNKNSFASLNSKINYSSAFDCLKEFLDKSLDSMSLIDERVILYYIHFFKYAYPTKEFNFNLIPDYKRARVITLINRIPSKMRKRRSKNLSSSSFNQGKLNPPLTPSSSAPIYEGIKSSSIITSQLTLPLAPSLLPVFPESFGQAEQSKVVKKSSSANLNNISDSNLIDLTPENTSKSNLIPNDNSDNEDALSQHESDNGSDSDSESESDGASDSICLPNSIQKSGSDSLSGSSQIGSESSFLSSNAFNASADQSSVDLTDLSSVASNDSFRRNSFLSESIDSSIGSANISPSSSVNTLLQIDENDVDHEDVFVGIYVPIDFPFEKPKITTMDQLSDKLPIDDPLVEIQLKHSTYDFDEEELLEVYEYYSKENNHHMIDLILKYAKKHEIELEIPNEIKIKDENPVPITHTIAIMKETDKLSKKQLNELCHYLNDNFTTNIQPNTRKSSELEKEELEENPESLAIIKKLLNCLTETTKEIKLKYLLLSLTNVLCTYNRIPFETAKLIITNFNDNFNKLPQNELSMLIESFCQRVCKKGRPARFLTRMQSITSIYNVGGNYITNSLALCKLLVQKDATTITQRFLTDKGLPSTFRNSTILLALLTKDPNIIAIDLFTASLQSIMGVYKTFKRNEPVHRQVSILFNTVFKEKNFEAIGRAYSVTISGFQLPSNSLYSSYSICIPRFAKFILNYSRANYDLKDSRLVPFCKEYFELLNVEIQFSDDKKPFVLKKIETFIEAIEKGKVCIEKLDEYILNWFLFLNQFFKFESIMKKLLPIAKIRFASFFLGVLKFVKLHKKDLSPEEMEIITKWKAKCHSSAFKFALTKNIDLINAAIQLSLYEEDNEDSEELVMKCERYYQKITEKK